MVVFVINGVSQDKCLTHYNRVCAWIWFSVYTMCRCYDPVISDEGSSTDMPSTHTKRNLPRPGMRAGVLAIHHSREGWTHATPYSELKVKNLNFKKNQEIFMIQDNTSCLTKIIVHPVIFRTQRSRTCLSQGLALMMPKYGNYYNLTNLLYQVLFSEFFQTTPSEFSDCFSETDKSSSSPAPAVIFYYRYC